MVAEVPRLTQFALALPRRRRLQHRSPTLKPLHYDLIVVGVMGVTRPRQPRPPRVRLPQGRALQIAQARAMLLQQMWQRLLRRQHLPRKGLFLLYLWPG